MFTDILFFRSCTCGGNPHVAGSRVIPSCNGGELLGSISDVDDVDEDLKDMSHDNMSYKHDHKWMVCNCEQHSVSFLSCVGMLGPLVCDSLLIFMPIQGCDSMIA